MMTPGTIVPFSFETKFQLTARIVAIALVAVNTRALSADLSPGSWPKAERERLEKIESQTWWSPLEAQTFESSGGIVSATVSPVAVYSGVQALKLGGNAADAAATTALTQITMQLGSVVSYAGIFTILYYDAKDHKVYSMDAGYNSYLHETDPRTIPVSEIGILYKSAPNATESGAKGRQTLVPGFMAGVEAMHSRFGHLPFRDLFEPAVWYAEHGVRISPVLQYHFTFRAKFLSLTPEGQQFMRQAGGEIPQAGDLFVQPELTKTLKAISENGSRYMYTGRWGEDFVRIVQREGGKVTAEDMKRYEPTWNEPHKETVFGHTVYVNGPPHTGAYALFVGLNIAEALKLDQKGPYWTDPETFQALARIGLIADAAPVIDKNTSSVLLGRGVDISADAQLGKGYAQAVAPLLDQIFTPPADNGPKHSNAIVVIDRDGNIAAITHTINAVVWGDAGIVVDGIPIPDSAGFQQLNLASIKPGDRVPNPIIDTIAFEGDIPVLATASIGASLQNESIRVLLGVLGQHQDLATVMAAPPLLALNDFSAVDKIASPVPVSIPQGAYGPDFIAKLKALGLNLTEIPAADAATRRGTLAAVAIDPKTGRRTAVNQPGVMVYNSTD
jgi:gamma-glutamyltranspeptidase/glutathione hydrolase